MNAPPEKRSGRLANLSSLRTPSEVLEAAQEVLSSSSNDGYALFLAGRANIELGHHSAALELLTTCRRVAPRQHWAAYEVSRCYLLTDQAALAVEPLEQFLGLHSQALKPPQIEVAERVLDRTFDLHPRPRMAALYRKLCELGSTRYLTALRAFEGAVESGDLEFARGLLPQIGWPGDAWGQLVLARFYANAGDAEQTERHAVAAQEFLGDHPIVAVAVVDLLRRVNRTSQLPRMLEAWRSKLPEAESALLDVCAAAQFPELNPNLLAALGSSFAHKWHFISYLYGAGDRLPEDRAELYAALEQRFPNDPDLLMCLANLEVGQRHFPAAQAFSDRGLQHAYDERMRLGFVFKLFEVACFQNDLSKAAQHLSEVDHSSLDVMQLAGVARYYAELGDWPQALAVLLRLLTPTTDIRRDHAQLVIRTARKVQAQRQVLDVLDQLPKPLQSQQQYLAGALFEDWLIGPDAMPELAQGYAKRFAIQPSDLLRFKLSSLAPDLLNALAPTQSASPDGASSIAVSQGPRRAVFFCADKAYVLPALISMASLLENNPGFATADFFLVVDDDIIPTAEPVMKALARHHGASIQAQPTSTLIPDAGKLGAGYGLFTGGHQLAAAAYYRIYMSRRLAESGNYDQLLYIDSDSIILPGYDEILDLPVPEGVFLMARLEVDRAEVREAIVQHGLPPGQYFNSGILWYPRSGPALVECLRNAERAAEERGAELLFQDQCALNIGFAGAFAPLDKRFNYFAGPGDADELLNSKVGQVAMLHVLDRPKPWDSAYPAGSVIQRRWMAAAQGLRRIVGADLVRPLVASMLK